MAEKRKYPDLHQHLEALEKEGLLLRIKRQINKDTELHPLVRWQFRGGLAEKERRAWLFENVVDCKGRHYSYPVAVGALAGSRYIYAVGMGCPVEEIDSKWAHALANPIEPVLVDSGPVHEEVIQGEALTRPGDGIERFPVPISTPGFDNGPYFTCAHWLTKDIETGIRNTGNYRGQIKSPTRIGFNVGQQQDGYFHWKKCLDKGIPLEGALIVGAPPSVSYAGVQKIPYGVDELTVAGGLVGEPIRLVKCKTVDLEVPAEAELVIEGIMPTDCIEPEGPFGESHGFIHPRRYNAFMDVTCITHRRDMVFVSFISQVTPSESSLIKKLGYEPLFMKFLREEGNIHSLKRVVLYEPLVNLRKLIILSMDKEKAPEAEVWRALHLASTFHSGVGKIVIAIDDDLDPENLDAVMWAMAYRMRPHKDIQIMSGMLKGHGPPFSRHDRVTGAPVADDSHLLINALLKEPFPPVSLPKKEFMENAKKIWEELGLPELRPESPWFGYSLGDWDEELEEEASLALKGEHYKTGEKLAGQRVPSK